MLNERFCVLSSINNDHGKYTYDDEKSRKSYVKLKHDTLHSRYTTRYTTRYTPFYI